MEEVVEVKRSPVVVRVGLCRWVLFKLHDLGVRRSSWRIGCGGWTRWAIAGLFRPRIVYQGFVLIAGEDTCWHRLSAGCRLCKRVVRLVEAPQDVIELEAVESILQPSNFLAVRLHLGVVAARLLHDLVDDQLGVASNVETSDASCGP